MRRNGHVILESSMDRLCRSIVPPLTHEQHKGECGRVGVLGGSPNYAGAPYFAAISAMRAGADLSYVFCPAEETSAVIKSYSPELIVHTLHRDKGGPSEKLISLMPRLHSLVIGPGLGLDWIVGQDIVKPVIAEAQKRGLPLVIDADGLNFVTNHPNGISGYQKAILTPNEVEFSRLYEKISPTITPEKADDRVEQTVQLSRALGHVTIVRKGRTDIITNGHEVLVCEVAGSMRRCGGQGDLLSGTMGLFTHWAHQAHAQQTDNSLLQKYSPTLTAAYTACTLTRACSQRAFTKHGRSMMTSDMIQFIANVFNELFEHEDEANKVDS